MQAARNSGSASAPGGRRAVAGSEPACFAYRPSPSAPAQALPTATADCCRNWRRPDVAAFAGCAAPGAWESPVGPDGPPRWGMGPFTSRLQHLDGAFLEVGFLRQRAGRVQGQLVDQAALVEERHVHQAARRLVAPARLDAGVYLAAP